MARRRTGSAPGPDVRVFADNGRWWLVSVSSRTQRKVHVVTVDPDGSRTPVPELCVPALRPLAQRETFFPNQLDPARRTRLEVSWRDHAGRDQAYTVDLPNDGLRDGRRTIVPV